LLNREERGGVRGEWDMSASAPATCRRTKAAHAREGERGPEDELTCRVCDHSWAPRLAAATTQGPEEEHQ